MRLYQRRLGFNPADAVEFLGGRAATRAAEHRAREGDRTAARGLASYLKPGQGWLGFGGSVMSYEWLPIVVAVNALCTYALWRRGSTKLDGRPVLNKKAADALWRSEPIVPKHDPPRVAGGEFKSMATDIDKAFFAGFREFADVLNGWLESEHVASRFRLQDLPAADLSLNTDFSHGPALGRCFAIYHNQTRVGRLEISPGGFSYDAKSPEVHTSLEINQVRFFDYTELTELLLILVWHLTSGEPEKADFKDARSGINTALTRTLWGAYRISEFDQADDWGELSFNFSGNASSYVRRRDAPARAKSVS